MLMRNMTRSIKKKTVPRVRGPWNAKGQPPMRIATPPVPILTVKQLPRNRGPVNSLRWRRRVQELTSTSTIDFWLSIHGEVLEILHAMSSMFSPEFDLVRRLYLIAEHWAKLYFCWVQGWRPPSRSEACQSWINEPQRKMGFRMTPVAQKRRRSAETRSDESNPCMSQAGPLGTI